MSSWLKKAGGIVKGAVKIGAGFVAGGPIGAAAAAGSLIAANNRPKPPMDQYGNVITTTKAYKDWERAEQAAAALQPLPLTSGGTVARTSYGTVSNLRGGSVGGFVGGVLGDLAGNAIRRYAGGGGGGNGCGCGDSSRDPCTRQKLSSQRAPEATFFGGCCPPGRVLRRRPWARDICAKQPRMNPFNPRALARADRRITTFARRTAPILRDMGYQVSRSRKVSLKPKKRRRRAA